MKSNKKESDEKMMKLTEYLKVITASTIVSIMDQIKIQKYLSAEKDSPKPQENTTVFPDNRRAPPLDGGQYTKIGGICNLKHEIRSPKLCELLTKT